MNLCCRLFQNSPAWISASQRPYNFANTTNTVLDIVFNHEVYLSKEMLFHGYS